MKTYSIGQLAERCGIATQAIRYYEQERLMPTPQRTESNYRRYPEEHVARLERRRVAASLHATMLHPAREDAPPVDAPSWRAPLGR